MEWMNICPSKEVLDIKIRYCLVCSTCWYIEAGRVVGGVLGEDLRGVEADDGGVVEEGAEQVGVLLQHRDRALVIYLLWPLAQLKIQLIGYD